MDNESSMDAPAIESSQEIDASSKFVTVSGGSRRVDVPDGEGYLITVEQGDSNGLPDGRYDLSKSVDASKQADRTFDGQVVHADEKHVYQLVKEEVVKHSVFEIAKETLPAIGAQIAVTYAAGIPNIAMASNATAISQTAQPAHAGATLDSQISENAKQPSMEKQVEANAKKAEAAPEQAIGSGGSVSADVAADINKMFSHRPPGSIGTDVSDASASHMSDMRSKIDASPEYAKEVHRVHPDLFDKAASPEAKEQIKKVIELSEKADQAKTLSGKNENSDEKKDVPKSAGDNREEEKRGFSVPAPIKTSVEARVHEARELLNRATTLTPMIAAKQMKDNLPTPQAAAQKAAQHTQQAKRGRSR